jgi:hypothetical protein
MQVWLRSAIAATTALVLAAPVAGQGRLLPETRYLRVPVAEPLAPRISVSLMSTSLLAEAGPERPPFTLPDPADAARDVVAAVSIGAVFPLLQVAQWDGGGVLLMADGRIFGRFRIEYPGRDDMGQDWFVGGGLEAAHRRWSGRLAVMHRSSHLGDEFAAESGAERIEFGAEHLEALAAYQLPGVARLYGGGTWVFRSYLRWSDHLRGLGVYDRGVVQAGLDREWQPWQDPRYRVLAGADVQAAERTGWTPAYSAAVGAGITTNRSLMLMVRAFDGRSHLGQFFLTHERYVSLELSARF